MKKSTSRSKSILFVTHDMGFFVSHRLPIAIAAQENGYRVAIVGPSGNNTDTLNEHRIRHIPLEIPKGLMRPGRLALVIFDLARIFERNKPTLVHLVASKPVILGGIVARAMRIPSVGAISGLGHVFIEDGFKAKVLRRVVLFGYRLALSGRESHAIFQNESNRSLFVSNGVNPERTVLIRGSGTDISRFDPSPNQNIVPVVLLPARMLWTKGVREFCEAARYLVAGGIKARFRLIGGPYPGNPASIDPHTLEALIKEGPVEWDGHVSNIAGAMHESDIIVLPSYSEGFPKTLIDAAAAGRATVTTDVPGCRDAIEPGVTGLLVRKQDSLDLSMKIRQLIDNAELRRSLGANGRAMAERSFSIEKIVGQHLDLYEKIAGRSIGG